VNELPDILDLLGRTPREFGAIHAHFESVKSIDRGRVIASLLLQGAFDPMPSGGEVTFYAGDPLTELGRFELPALEGGVALRFQCPLRIPAEVASLQALLTVPEPPKKSKRVRPAWKLHDTFEIPKLSEMEPISDSASLNLGASLIGTAALGGAGLLIVGTRSATLAANNRTTVHKARELPAMLNVALSTDVGAPISVPESNVLWRPGQPVPEPTPMVFKTETAAKPSSVRRCRLCDFEGPAAEYERARSCPRCDAPWL
jgi:hypothetical protein